MAPTRPSFYCLIHFYKRNLVFRSDMMLLVIFLAVSSVSSLQLEVYTERRSVTDPDGTNFLCLYTLSYDPNTAKVYRQQSSVKCEPNIRGKQTVEDITIEAIGKVASVTYVPRKDLVGIKKITLAEYTAPETTTSAVKTTTTPAPGDMLGYVFIPEQDAA